MRVRTEGALLSIAAAAVAACNAITGASDLEADGLDDAGVVVGDGGGTSGATSGGTDAGPRPDSGSSSSGTTSSSSSGGALTCTGGGGRCVPEAPAGWDGPFAVFDSGNAQCPAALQANVFDRKTGAPTGTFSCPACKCESPTGGVCTGTLTTFTDAACATPSGTVEATTCTKASATVVGGRFTYAVTNAGTCAPALASSPSKGPISWPGSLRFCGADTLSAVGCASTSERCLPSAPGAKVCVVREGTHSCPAPWTASTAVYAQENDTRACAVSSCSCGDPSGVTCKGGFASFTANNCTGFFPFVSSVPVDTCFALESGGSTKTATGNPLGVQGGSCAVSGSPSVTGSLSAGAPTTTCCLPGASP